MPVEIFDHGVGVLLGQIINLDEVRDVIITKLEEILAAYQLLFRDVRIRFPSIFDKARARMLDLGV
jgi:hypothetical protein